MFTQRKKIKKIRTMQKHSPQFSNSEYACDQSNQLTDHQSIQKKISPMPPFSGECPSQGESEIGNEGDSNKNGIFKTNSLRLINRPNSLQLSKILYPTIIKKAYQKYSIEI